MDRQTRKTWTVCLETTPCGAGATRAPDYPRGECRLVNLMICLCVVAWSDHASRKGLLMAANMSWTRRRQQAPAHEARSAPSSDLFVLEHVEGYNGVCLGHACPFHTLVVVSERLVV